MKSAPVLLLWAVITSATVRAQSASINVGDATLAYEVSGSGAPLVLIHGWGQDLAIWNEIVPGFAQHYRVIRYDRRGYGRSTGFSDATADPEDLRVFLDSLRIRSAILLGLSAGARTALNFAVAFPDRVRALVIYGQAQLPGFTPAPTGPTPVMMFREIAQKYGLDSAGKALMAHQLSWTPAESPHARDVLLAQWKRYAGHDLLDPRPESGRVPHATLDQVARVTVPALVISGDHDLPLFLAVGDTLANRIGDAHRAIIHNAGHSAHLAQPREFTWTVLQFLDLVERGQRRK